MINGPPDSLLAQVREKSRCLDSTRSVASGANDPKLIQLSNYALFIEQVNPVASMIPKVAHAVKGSGNSLGDICSHLRNYLSIIIGVKDG